MSNARKQRAVLREVISKLRASTHELIDAELFGSLDTLVTTIDVLERQHKELRGRKGEVAA